jgi:cytochrome oxidase Cu insertion factor (SCO1/SenC/PrrC family)
LYLRGIPLQVEVMMNVSRIALPCLALVVASAISAQQPTAAPAPAPLPIPEVGSAAPDFTFRAVTKDGIQTKSAKLSDYKGQTVVIWFFFKARTKG